MQISTRHLSLSREFDGRRVFHKQDGSLLALIVYYLFNFLVCVGRGHISMNKVLQDSIFHFVDVEKFPYNILIVGTSNVLLFVSSVVAWRLTFLLMIASTYQLEYPLLTKTLPHQISRQPSSKWSCVRALLT